ncbi:type II toxin-antitoxin system Phd/YefM family antitoxin [bacterium]|nr:type II toxin-antitoxin system Phd/YefM family antitoxin [bacterium]
MHTISSSKARQNFFELLKKAKESHEPIQITWKDSNAILISQEDWESIQETLYLLSFPGLRDTIVEGMKTPLDKCSKDLDW